MLMKWYVISFAQKVYRKRQKLFILTQSKSLKQIKTNADSLLSNAIDDFSLAHVDPEEHW